MTETNPEQSRKVEVSEDLEKSRIPQSRPAVQPTHQSHQSKPEGKWAKQFKYYWTHLKRFSKECRRVMKIIQRPNKEEFFTISKVSALGLGIVGIIGFILSMIQQLVL